jgi:hypothetical protein
MRKIVLLISILGLLILACSTTSLFPTSPTPLAQVALPLPTDTLPVAFTPTPSMAPTQVPPTFTPTPTFIETIITPTVASTDTPVLTMTIPATSTSPTVVPTQPTPQGPVFNIVMLSGNQINWGNSCSANTVTLTAQVVNGFDVTSVLLFTRLLSQTRTIPTPWNSAITMHNDGMGTFTYDLSQTGIARSQEFTLAWVQYQLVATNSSNKIVGRTQVYENTLTITFCP